MTVGYNSQENPLQNFGNACTAGCAGRYSETEMRNLLGKAGLLDRQPDPDLLVGIGDDAVIRRVGAIGIATSTDTIRPVVHDPETFGWIAAVHAASDIDAVGGQLIDALTTLGWPRGTDDETAAKILAGAARAMSMEYGITIAGGHTISSDEPFLGVSVTGTVDPDKLITLDGGNVGDELVLATKPIGTGIIVRDMLEVGVEVDLAVAARMHMCVPNRLAGGGAVDQGVRAGTDVTGSGLIGTIHKLALASGCSAIIRATEVDSIHGVLDLFVNSITAPGKRNLSEATEYTDWRQTPAEYQRLFTDPQTSGPLLLATPHGQQLVNYLDRLEVAADIIGKLDDGTPGRIVVDANDITP